MNKVQTIINISFAILVTFSSSNGPSLGNQFVGGIKQ